MATAQPPKVLRIGIIVDGKIVQERMIKLGENVTIGESPKNTFVLTKLQLPKQDWPVFVYKGGKYYLNFTESMKGKVGAGGSVVGLDKLRQDPSVEKDASAWRLPLSESDRGKVAVIAAHGAPDVTVLFQFVSPPPPSAVKAPRRDFTPRLLEEDDALLFVFLLVFGTGAAVLVLFAILFLPPEEESTSLDQLDEKWTKLLIPEPPAEVPDAPTVDKADEKAEEKKPEEKKAEEVAKPTNEPVKTKAERVADAKGDILKKNQALQFLTTRGDSAEGTARDLWSQGDVGSAAKSLDGVSGVAAADENNIGLRGDAGTPGGNKDINDLGKIGGDQSVKVAAAPTVVVEVSAGEGTVDDIPESDQASIKKIVTKNSGQLKYCYETRLKSNPDLSGRVEIAWNIAGGRVTAAEVFANTTGDSELAECIVGKVQRWTGFPPEAEGEVQWPFIFKQKQ